MKFLHQRLFTTSRQVQTKVMIITGPTASGKSNIAAEISRKIRGEIINVDSTQLYREMNIGTNKSIYPDVPTHLMDIISVNDEPIGAGEYLNLAKSEIDRLVGQSIIPIVSGGSGFFLQCLMHEKLGTVKSDLNYKEDIKTSLSNIPWDSAIQRLSIIDPAYARTIERNDFQRLSRALEIVEKTGKPVPYLKVDLLPSGTTRSCNF